MRHVLNLLFPLLLAGTACAADLPVTETPIGRLALPVVPDSMVISPDSSRLAFATNAGQITLEDKGVFLQPPGGRQGAGPGRAGATGDLPRNVRSTIRLYIDDKATSAFEVLTPVVFSPDSQRFGYTGQREGKWQVVVDTRAVVTDADAVPATPLLFSPDSKRVATIVQKAEKFLVTVDGEVWPAIDAFALGVPAFSPDSAHLAMVGRAKGAWVLYVDGKMLPAPPVPAAAAGAAARGAAGGGGGPATRAGGASPAAASRPAPYMDRFGEFKWRPDSSGIVFFGGMQGARWQVFSQGLDGAFSYVSPQVEALGKGGAVLSPEGRIAFAATTRGKWSVVTDTQETPPAAAQGFDAVRPESVAWLTADGGPRVVYLAQRARKWQVYVDHEAIATVGEGLDGFTEGSFHLSPDRRHYAFAGIRAGKGVVVKDGKVLGTHDELGAGTFAFSPDSQQLVYAARNGTQWFVCVDGAAGTAGFAGVAAQRISFSSDSRRVAFNALGADKTWRLVVGKNGEFQTKGYDSFVKGTVPTWRDEATVVTIGVSKRVAQRVEAKVPR